MILGKGLLHDAEHFDIGFKRQDLPGESKSPKQARVLAFVRAHIDHTIHVELRKQFTKSLSFRNGLQALRDLGSGWRSHSGVQGSNQFLTKSHNLLLTVAGLSPPKLTDGTLPLVDLGLLRSQSLRLGIDRPMRFLSSDAGNRA